MRDRLYTTEALIIRRSDVGEADRILTIYTPHHGKLSVTARGVRKMTSKLAGHLELFIHTRLQLAKGRSFDVVTESRVVQPFRSLREDLSRISQGYYVAELLDQMTPDESDNLALFRLTCETLAALDVLDDVVRRDVILRYYELHTLILSGYRPHLFHCANCERELSPEADRYSPITGGVLCQQCSSSEPRTLPINLNTFKLLRYLARMPLETVVSLVPAPATVHEARAVLKASLSQILERELKSTQFLNLVRG